jgi:hypothetical protein
MCEVPQGEYRCPAIEVFQPRVTYRQPIGLDSLQGWEDARGGGCHAVARREYREEFLCFNARSSASWPPASC